MRLFFLLLIPISLLSQVPDFKPVPRVQVVPLPHHVTSFQIDGRELTALHFDPLDMRPFWYPLLGSKDISLTRMGHPHDPLTHSHHNSVWISHNSVNELDFWGDQAKNQGRIIPVEVSREGYEDGDSSASMRMVNHWVNAADQSIQLREIRRTEIRPINGAQSWFMIIDLELAPQKGKTAILGATGFGLIAVRVAKSIGVHDGGGRILNSKGQINEEQIFRKPARWCDYSGRISNAVDGLAGITLMNHPMNPHNPTAFHVRNDGWMGCCLSLDAPVEVTESQKLRVRYALWVHDGIPKQNEIEHQWQTFVSFPVTDLTAKK